VIKIVLVEDDPTIRSLLKIFLELDGFQVSLIEPVTDINTTLISIEEINPEILITDVYLQYFSGIDLVGKIRQNKNLGSMYIIMTSGENLHQKCTDAGADYFLLKPYMPDILINILHSHFLPTSF